MIAIPAKSLKYIFYGSCFFFLLSCSQQSHESETEIGSGSPKDIIEGVVTEPETIEYDLIYMTIVPSNDRGTFKTTLKLSTKQNKFSLKEEYAESNSSPNIQLGSFNIERGFEKDENATVYILNDELPENERLYFLRETGKDNVLVQLDKDKRRPQFSQFVLNKVSSN